MEPTTTESAERRPNPMPATPPADFAVPETERGRVVELTTAGMADSELGYERVLTLREAAELCQTTYTALRKRADRGSLRTVKRGNTRMVPLSELEREGLVPGAAERALEARVADLEAELATHRTLTERAESEVAAEREARERAEAAVHEHRAMRIAAELEREELRHSAGGLLGPWRVWRRARGLEEVAS